MEDKSRYTLQVERSTIPKESGTMYLERDKKRTILECWNSCDSLPSRVVSVYNAEKVEANESAPISHGIVF